MDVEIKLNPLRVLAQITTGLHPRLFKFNPVRIFFKPRRWFNLNNPVRSAGKDNKAQQEPRSGFNKALIIKIYVIIIGFSTLDLHEF